MKTGSARLGALLALAPGFSAMWWFHIRSGHTPSGHMIAANDPQPAAPIIAGRQSVTATAASAAPANNRCEELRFSRVIFLDSATHDQFELKLRRIRARTVTKRKSIVGTDSGTPAISKKKANAVRMHGIFHRRLLASEHLKVLL